MRKAVVVGLVALLGACTSVSAADLRLTEARSIARLRAEKEVDLSLTSLSRSGVLDDIDCSQETGIDAEQCNAFMTLMASHMETLRTEEKKRAMADAADEIEALAVAMTYLSDADFSALRTNADLPPESDQIKPLSAVGEQIIKEPMDVLFDTLSASDRSAGDRVQALVTEVLTKLMTDPALQ